MSELPYVVTDEPAWWTDQLPPAVQPASGSGLLAASGHYDLPLRVAELPELLRAALHGSIRLVPTRIDDDSAEIRRRTSLAVRADLLHVRYLEKEEGSRLDVQSSRTVFLAETRADLTAFFEAIRAELARRAETDGDPGDGG